MKATTTAHGTAIVPAFVPSNVAPLYPYVDNGVLYTTDKIVYLSPRFGGFDAGVSFEPSFVTINNSTSCTDRRPRRA